MAQVLAVLILVPTAAVLILASIYIVGAILGFFAAGIDGLVVGIEHRVEHTSAGRMRHHGTPALHH